MSCRADTKLDPLLQNANRDPRFVAYVQKKILMELKWALESGGSEKQFLDALRVYKVQFQRLDFAYINEWVSRLALESLWDRFIREARPE